MIHQAFEQMSEMRLRDMSREMRRQTELPAMDDLSFEERFSMAIDAEWIGRQNRKLGRLLNSAGLPEPSACLEDIDYDAKRKIDRAHIARLSGCDWIKKDIRHLLVTGATGTGKTWIASAFANAACRMGFKVKCFKTVRLLEELRVGRNDGTWAGIVDGLLKPDLLFIDDFGMAPLDALQSRDLFEIVEERKFKGPLLITSQLPVSDWHQMFGDATAANAVMDRLANNSHRIPLSGSSKRRRDSHAEQTAAAAGNIPDAEHTGTLKNE
jgi:DNA replication protein DnaC